MSSELTCEKKASEGEVSINIGEASTFQPMEDYGISCTELSGSATTMLVTYTIPCTSRDLNSVSILWLGQR
jgi:hypothetical protein